MRLLLAPIDPPDYFTNLLPTDWTAYWSTPTFFCSIRPNRPKSTMMHSPLCSPISFHCPSQAAELSSSTWWGCCKQPRDPSATSSGVAGRRRAISNRWRWNPRLAKSTIRRR